MTKTHKAIKIDDNKYVIVDEESEIKENQLGIFNHPEHGNIIGLWLGNGFDYSLNSYAENTFNFIHTNPIPKKGLIIATINHPLKGIPEIVIKNEVNLFKLLENIESTIHKQFGFTLLIQLQFERLYKYQLAQKKYQFTEEDLRKSFKAGFERGYEASPIEPDKYKSPNIDDYLEFLKQPKEIETVELEYEELGGDNKTNSFGKKQIYYQQLKIYDKEKNQIIPVKINYKT